MVARVEDRLRAGAIGVAGQDREHQVDALDGVREASMRGAEQRAIGLGLDLDGGRLVDLDDRATGRGELLDLARNGLGQGDREPVAGHRAGVAGPGRA